MPPIREGKVGKAEIKLGKTPRGYAVAVIEGHERKFYEEGDDPDGLWMRAHDAAARLNPLFVGYDGARKRFLHFFPQGFRGTDYVGQERDYKLKAKAKLDAGAPLERAASGSGFGDLAVSAYQATNVLSPFEKAKLVPILRGPDGDRFIQAAAMFALGDVEGGLKRMQAILKPHGQAKWTVVTYLPFLWRPEQHIFLKPVMMTTFAQRVGHRFADLYSPELDPATYQALLDLASEVRGNVVDLGARDMIDVQSFMYTAVDYIEDDLKDYERSAAPTE